VVTAKIVIWLGLGGPGCLRSGGRTAFCRLCGGECGWRRAAAGAAGFLVVIAEGAVDEGGRLAEEAVGFGVAAEGIGGFLHRTSFVVVRRGERTNTGGPSMRSG
jgi:hypothetical protein